MLNNPYGDFSENGREFIINTPDIPRNWYNYMWNDTYITFVSQVAMGEGFCQDNMGNRVELVRSRNVYIMEDDVCWTANALPVDREYKDYQCVHGIGYTNIRLAYRQVESHLGFFVPNEGNHEIWTLKLKNHASAPKKLKAIAYFSTEIDGKPLSQGYNTSTAGFSEKLQSVIGNIYKKFDTKETVALKCYFTCNQKITGFDSRKTAFIGTYGTEQTPKALKSGGCTNSDCNGEKICFAVETEFFLEAGEEQETAFICGVAYNEKEVAHVKGNYQTMALVYSALEKVKNKFATQETAVSMNTPNESLNKLLNNWLTHATNMGSRWARVRHNGYRDITSDCDCLSAINPQLAYERFKRILTYQYTNGYAPRTFIDGKIQDNHFSDNAVWIPMTLYSIVNALGDINILNEQVAFNDGTTATVYEHAKRAVAFLYNFKGQHDLIKIWGGDWNDCMNTAGLEGKGVSVWLSIAWYRANRQLIALAKMLGYEQDVKETEKRGAIMKELVNQYGWDGEYYLTAYKDNGEKIGSHENEDGKIFLIPQLWAVLSEISKDGRELTAMEAVEKYLDTPMGTLVSTPAYSKLDNSLGSITQKPAGVHENGGVYLHTMAWKLAVDCLLKRPENVEKTLYNILPFTNTCVNNKAEPYILCNSYFGEETGYRYSTPGQSWRSASGPWFLKAMILYVFGLKPEIKGLRIEPCLPISWKNCSIHKKFRNAEYHIEYVNHGVNIKKITVNGVEIEGNVLPYQDGASYNVIVETCL